MQSVFHQFYAGDLTVVNSTQEFRPATDSLTVERSSVVTIACWTWCGYVDWSTITPSGRDVPGLGVTQSNCSSNGTCQTFIGIPDCTDVQPGQGNQYKHQLSLLANETFYIDCLPQCPFGKENNKLEGRTNGLLVKVVGKQNAFMLHTFRHCFVKSLYYKLLLPLILCRPA